MSYDEHILVGVEDRAGSESGFTMAAVVVHGRDGCPGALGFSLVAGQRYTLRPICSRACDPTVARVYHTVKPRV